MYYQTTILTPEQLSFGFAVAKTQDEAIYNLMLKGGEWNCWQIKKLVAYEITSIRRSLNTLNKAGKIELVDYVPGEKGRPVGSYKIIGNHIYLTDKQKNNDKNI